MVPVYYDHVDYSHQTATMASGKKIEMLGKLSIFAFSLHREILHDEASNYFIYKTSLQKENHWKSLNEIYLFTG